MAISVFGSTKVTAPKKNIFDLSHSVKMSGNAGYLYPAACIPIVPGDSFDIKADVFCRLAPLATPVLANMDIRMEAFYVPNRIVWPNWEKFIVFEHRPNNDPKPVLPYLDLYDAKTASDSDSYNRVGVGSLADYLGLPVTQFTFPESGESLDADAADLKVSALPFAAYQKIWLDYYCDKNIQESLIDTYYSGSDGKGGLYDGDNTQRYLNLMTLHHRMWRKDYFTSALPDAQRGSDVLIPVTGGDVSIHYGQGETFAADKVEVAELTGSNYAMRINDSDGESDLKLAYGASGTNYPASIDNSANLSGTVDGVNATITDLRTAMATQRLLELSMRVGSRLKEQLLGIFGVKSSDTRLDRAEYLGGSSVPIMIGEVAQTSSTDNTSPQGNMAGKGIGAGQLSYGRKYFEEHGYLIVMCSIVPKAAYFQGMARHFKNFDMEDFYWPMFQHIGEQAIRNEEIYFGTSDENNNNTFGYAPRYSDYKWLPSTVKGEFRTSNLNNMHMARIFESRPYLNQDFLNIRANVANRCFAVTSADYHHFWLDIYFKIKAKRPMDYFGSPI